MCSPAPLLAIQGQGSTVSVAYARFNGMYIIVSSTPNLVFSWIIFYWNSRRLTAHEMGNALYGHEIWAVWFVLSLWRSLMGSLISLVIGYFTIGFGPAAYPWFITLVFTFLFSASCLSFALLFADNVAHPVKAGQAFLIFACWNSLFAGLCVANSTLLTKLSCAARSGVFVHWQQMPFWIQWMSPASVVYSALR